MHYNTEFANTEFASKSVEDSTEFLSQSAKFTKSDADT
jgi:hypothetical protein